MSNRELLERLILEALKEVGSSTLNDAVTYEVGPYSIDKVKSDYIEFASKLIELSKPSQSEELSAELIAGIISGYPPHHTEHPSECLPIARNIMEAAVTPFINELKSKLAEAEKDVKRLDSQTIVISNFNEFGEIETTLYKDIDLREKIDEAIKEGESWL